MSAPDFYFGVNATFRYIYEREGYDALVTYWQNLGRDYYQSRWERWRDNSLQNLADDWENYFQHEPQSQVSVTTDQTSQSVLLDIHVCPAIKHLNDNSREIMPHFCEHCDHITGAMAQKSGYRFQRTGGMGTCQQQFVKISIESKKQGKN